VGDTYKCIIGMDLLEPLDAVIRVKERVLTLKDQNGQRFSLRLYSKDMIRTTALVREFCQW
jgi:pyruvate formate-lyase activating enzyme-like uncharacterized protein